MTAKCNIAHIYSGEEDKCSALVIRNNKIRLIGLISWGHLIHKLKGTPFEFNETCNAMIQIPIGISKLIKL